MYHKQQFLLKKLLLGTGNALQQELEDYLRNSTYRDNFSSQYSLLKDVAYAAYLLKKLVHSVFSR